MKMFSAGMTKEQHHEFMRGWKKENNIPEAWPEYDLDMLWAKYEKFKSDTGTEITLNQFSESWTKAYNAGSETESKRGIAEGIADSELGKAAQRAKGGSREELIDYLVQED